MEQKTSTDVLLQDLIAAKAPSFMIRKAKAGQYNDYKSDSAHPIMDLVRDAASYNLREIITHAKAGKYDGTLEEGNAWFAREGKDLLP